MNPKYILIKSQNPILIQTLLFHLKELKQVRFFYFKYNGFYTITIKCHNYYNSKDILNENKLYGNYTFLYSLISIILSDLLIEYYEHDIVRRLLQKHKIQKKELSKLSNISSLLLDKNSPFEFSNLLYTKRKNHLLNALFQNFRKRNFIFLDYFLDFNAEIYKKQLQEILEASLEIIENKSLYQYLMQFIIDI